MSSRISFWDPESAKSFVLLLKHPRDARLMQMPWKISIADNYRQINYSVTGDGGEIVSAKTITTSMQ